MSWSKAAPIKIKSTIKLDNAVEYNVFPACSKLKIVTPIVCEPDE